MAEEKQEHGCWDGEAFYPNGSEYCMDVYCFKCTDGEFEVCPSIGASTDLIEIW